MSALLLAGCAKSDPAANAEEAAADLAEQTRLVEERYPEAALTASGLRYVVLQPGRGEEKPAAGATVMAHYTLELLDGSKIDSSRERGHPFTFRVGRGEVVAAWDEAFLDMRRGERRALIAPPSLGYGAAGAGGVIPPGAYLVFEVELVDFR